MSNLSDQLFFFFKSIEYPDADARDNAEKVAKIALRQLTTEYRTLLDKETAEIFTGIMKSPVPQDLSLLPQMLFSNENIKSAYLKIIDNILKELMATVSLHTTAEEKKILISNLQKFPR